MVIPGVWVAAYPACIGERNGSHHFDELRASITCLAAGLEHWSNSIGTAWGLRRTEDDAHGCVVEGNAEHSHGGIIFGKSLRVGTTGARDQPARAFGGGVGVGVRWAKVVVASVRTKVLIESIFNVA